ncbi:HNH endonuclease [Ferroplasma sp.]|jgi:hypothetical protein|uniref:HNH endonuclease n=1 Tax=Ferroplasma sp. TaxID=2591003 RepID=UPI002607994B|nr:HNH endonuclease [Ferroplasma sp.]
MGENEQYYPDEVIGKIVRISHKADTGIFEDEYIEEFRNGGRLHWNTPTNYLKKIKNGIMMLYDPDKEGITVEFKVYDIKNIDGKYKFSNKFRREDVKIFEPAIPLSTIVRVPRWGNFKETPWVRQRKLFRKQYDALLGQYHGNIVRPGAEGKRTSVNGETQLEMVKEALVSMGGKCKNQEIKDYIIKKWPDQNPGSIDDAINIASVNRESRVNYPENQKVVNSHREKYDFLFSIERGIVELYNPNKHGNWGILKFRGKYRIYKGETPPDTSDYEEKYGILYQTDLNRIKFLNDPEIRTINFWSIMTNKLDSLYEGMPFFFKTEDQKIAGYANFIKSERMTPDETWVEFKKGNGAPNRETFLGLLKKDGWGPSDVNEGKITCFELQKPVFFTNPPSIYDCGISAFETPRYIDSIESSNISDEIEEFEPLDLNPDEVHGSVHSESKADGRPYQAELRKVLFKMYQNKCAICELNIPNLLFVSHIIPHSANDTTARRLDNSILLCAIHDALFDKGLITINHEGGKYIIRLSKDLIESKNPAVKRIRDDLANAKFNCPIDYPPSENSLQYHNKKIFIDASTDH